MSLTETEIARIRQSFDRLREQKTGRDPFGTDFYDRLFARAPETRALFREDLAEQGMRFLSTLAVIVGGLDRPDALDPQFERLAAGHRAYGVRPEHFAPMGEALRETMAATLGERYDAETDAAWARAYDLIAARVGAASAA